MADNELPSGFSAVPDVVTERFSEPGRNGSGGLDRLLGYSGMESINVSCWIPGYWSMKREHFLRQLYLAVDEVKLAVGVTTRHLTSIRPNVEACDLTDGRAVMSAELQQFILHRDWDEVGKALSDSLVHDMGGYLEVLSFYEPDEQETVTREGAELIGVLEPWQVPGSNGVYLSAAGLKALDPLQCIPTRDAEYPVLYKDHRGRRYALHHTRVIRLVNQPSSVEKLNGIGLSYLSQVIVETGQIYHAQRIQTAILEGKPIKGMMLVAPWDGATVKKQISDLYNFGEFQQSLPGGNVITPIAVVGVPEEWHRLNGSMIDGFQAQMIELERLPEGYDRDKWSESLFRKWSAASGLPVNNFGLELKFSSRADSESKSSSIHNVAASWFRQWAESKLRVAFCTLDTCLATTYNDEILEKRAEESRRLRAETYEINLMSGAADLESVLDDRVRNGDITESDRERILSSTSTQPPSATEKSIDIWGGGKLVDYNALCGFDEIVEPDPIPDSEKSESSYSQALRAIVRGVWRGEFDTDDAADQMFIVVADNMREVAYDAAGRLGVDPDELTDDEVAAINRMIDVHADSIDDIVQQASDNSRENGGKLQPLLNRLQLWYPRYNQLADEISASVGSNLKFRWERRADKESCKDCIKLDGRVARGSAWKARVLPRSRALDCGGWECGCRLQQTRDAVTRGRWPAAFPKINE